MDGWMRGTFRLYNFGIKTIPCSPRDIAEREDDFSRNERYVSIQYACYSYVIYTSPQDIGEEEDEHHRDAKLMLYWVTTTSTTTSYTSTSTLATINCTPNDWTMLACSAG